MSEGLAGRTVLLVDDELFFLESVREGLLATEPEVRVHMAANGLEALQVLEANDIDVVVSDIRMPKLDGVGLLSEMMSRGCPTPVILLSAYRDVAETERAATLGATVFLDKPVEYDELLSAIQHALRPGEQTWTHGFSTSSMLQLMRAEQKSAGLNVHSEDGFGRIFVSGGEVVDAWCDSVYGDEAFARILAFRAPALELVPLAQQVERCDTAEITLVPSQMSDTPVDTPSPFGVDDYIQLACMGRHSVRIDVVSDAVTGVIFVGHGRIWSAMTDTAAGEDALRELLFVRASVSCRRAEKLPRTSNLPETSWEQQLLNLAKNHDEGEPNQAETALEDDPFDFSNIFDDVPVSPQPRPVEPPKPPPRVGRKPHVEFARLVDAGADALLRKDYNEALRAYEAASRLQPDDPVVSANLARLLEITST